MKIHLTLGLLLISFSIMAQENPNYDESKVPPLGLPDLFVSQKGIPIQNKVAWENERRSELLQNFANEVYGQLPADYDKITYEEKSVASHPYEASTQMQEVTIQVTRNSNQLPLKLFLFKPKETQEPLPVVLLISHRNVSELIENVDDKFFPIEEIVSRGFAAAVFDVADVSPDDKESFSKGILEQLYPEQLEMPNGMRGLGAWAWGAMRAMDYFESSSVYHIEKSMVIGHSRGGKAALWCGANDQRWAITVSNESGCGGAALSKREFGERVERINTTFPFWFTDNFKKYNGKEASMPFDQHMLLSLIAPRALYVASSKDDEWADPKGEFLSLLNASRVYQDIYQLSNDLPHSFNPEVNTVHLNQIGYHLREGEHDLSWYDWERFLDFASNKFFEE